MYNRKSSTDVTIDIKQDPTWSLTWEPKTDAILYPTTMWTNWYIYYIVDKLGILYT